MTVRVGIVGTSWWTDAMYLPALREHPAGEVTALCGRNRENAQKLAEQYGITRVFTDYGTLIDSGEVDALIVATPNDTHYPITMRALEAGLHVLCEKPLGMNYTQAKQMADLAASKGVRHMVPFTYRFMPVTRYMHELVETGYLGKPYHLNLRFYAGYGRGGDYMWRFDADKAGSGVVGDLGSHHLYLAYWFFGPIKRLSAQLGYLIARDNQDSGGKSYAAADDVATILLEFENGAQGVVQVTTVAYEPTAYGHTQHYDLHGSAGTLRGTLNWDAGQAIIGAREGDSALHDLPIPDSIWEQARRGNPVETYKDVFRKGDHMARSFVTAVAEGRPCSPDFADGAHIQRVVDAAVKSHREGRRVDVEEIQ